MATRQVRATGKDRDGDITSLCNGGEIWSPRLKQSAIREIESNEHIYFVSWPNQSPTLVHVVDGPTGKYLRTDRDQTSRNNLDDLPDC